MATRAEKRYFYNTGSATNWYDPTKVKKEYSAADKAAIVTALSDSTNGVVARVSVAQGDVAGANDDYVKIKFYRNGLPLAIYKSKAYAQADAIAFRNEVLTELGLTPPA